MVWRREYVTTAATRPLLSKAVMVSESIKCCSWNMLPCALAVVGNKVTYGRRKGCWSGWKMDGLSCPVVLTGYECLRSGRTYAFSLA